MLTCRHSLPNKEEMQMTTFKKSLSLLLSLAMILGTFAVALSVNASAATSQVKTYAQLAAEPNFVYLAAELYDSENNLVDEDGTGELNLGEEYTVKYYLKSDYAIYKYRLRLFFNDAFFEVVRGSLKMTTPDNKASLSDDQPMEEDGKFIVEGGDYDDDGNPIYVSALSDYDKDELLTWHYAEIASTSTSVKVTNIDEPFCTFKLKIKKTASGTGRIFSPNKSVSAQTGKNSGEMSYLALGANTTSAQKKKADHFDASGCNKNYKVGSIGINFDIDGDHSVGEFDSNETLVFPENDNVFAWYDQDDPGQMFVKDDIKVTPEIAGKTFVAVLKTATVNVTLDAGPGQVGSASTKSFAAPVTGLSFTDTPTYTDNGKSVDFNGWVPEGYSEGYKAGETYDFISLQPVTFNASWGAGIRINVGNIDGTWKTYEIYTGTYGADVTIDDIDAMLAIIRAGCRDGENVATKPLKDYIGAGEDPVFYRGDQSTDEYGTAYDVICANKYSVLTDNIFYYDAGDGKYQALLRGKRNDNPTANIVEAANAKFGTLTDVYINTFVLERIFFHIPEYDDNGIAKKDDNGNFIWKTEKEDVMGAFSATTTSAADPGPRPYGYWQYYFESKYKEGTELVEIPATNARLPYSILQPYLEKVDRTRYNVEPLDGNGKPFEVKKEMDTETNTYVDNYVLNNSHWTQGTTDIDIYITLTDRLYTLSISGNPDKDFSSSDAVNTSTQVKIGDKVDASSFANIGNTSLDALKEDGANLTGKNLKGYKLEKLYYVGKGEVDQGQGIMAEVTDPVNGEGEIDITAGGTVEITHELIKLIGNTKDELIFYTHWTARDAVFKVYYLNANMEWTLLCEKVLIGKEPVTYASVVGAGSELDALIKKDTSDKYRPMTDGFAATKEDALKGTKITDNLYAYDGPMDLYIAYTVSGRNAFIKYNDKSTEKNIGYIKSPDLAYGTVLYDPEYNAAAYKEAGLEAPYFNLQMGSYKPDSEPEAKPVEDSDGNIVYNKLYEIDGKTAVRKYTCKDCKTESDEWKHCPHCGAVNRFGGEYVLDENGQPTTTVVCTNCKQVVASNEWKLYCPNCGGVNRDEGVPVDDTENPVMDDKKGNWVSRPYRNCEYMGYTVYYVDGVYSNYEDLPAESEWKEGYNDKGDYCLYTTTIAKVDWMSDANFRVRVYDDNNELFCATMKGFKKYYWKDEQPCNKGEGALNHKSETAAIILLLPHIEKIPPENFGLEPGSQRDKLSLYFTTVAVPFEPIFFIKHLGDAISGLGFNALKGLLV